MKAPQRDIRPGTEADIDAMLELLKLLFFIEEDFEFVEEKQRRGLQMMLANPNGHIIVADINNRVVGMCSGQLTVSTAEGGWSMLVEDVVVLPEHRGEGIARSMLAALADWAGQKGVRRCQLLADCNNQAALRFYEHLDWQRTALVCLKKNST